MMPDFSMKKKTKFRLKMYSGAVVLTFFVALISHFELGWWTFAGYIGGMFATILIYEGSR